MDIVFRRSLILLLTSLFLLFPVLASAIPTSPPSSGYYSTLSDALAACNAYRSFRIQYVSDSGGPCKVTSETSSSYHVGYVNSYGTQGNFIASKPTAAQCAAEPSAHYGSTNLSGTELTCYQGCEYGFTPDPGQIQVCIGGSCTAGQSGTVAPTGNTCSGSHGDATPDYQPPPKPKLCGGGSCYDPGTNQYCAVGGNGQQVCVPAGKAANTGATATTPDAALSAGNPPPPPPNPPIIDPATDIQTSDTYQQSSTDANGNLLPGAPVTVNTYGKGGEPTSSGQVDGDQGPAPPSSTAGADQGHVSGGLDCNTPPICSGDAVNCAVVSQTWLSRCHNHDDLEQLHHDITDTGDFEQPGPVSKGDLWQDGASGTGNSIADNALHGNFDQSGLGFSEECPLHDLTIDLPGGHSFAISFSNGCQYGDWIRAIVIAFALFSAAKIVTGGRG